MLKEVILDDATSIFISAIRDKIFAFIKEKALYNPVTNLEASDTILNLLKSAFSVLKQNDYFGKIPHEDLEQLFSDNIELVVGWIFTPFPAQFAEDEVAIPNYEYEKECKAFLNGLYNFIVIEGNRYNNSIVGFTNVSNQVLQVQNSQNLMMNDTNQIKAMLQNIQARLPVTSFSADNSSFSKELMQIDDCIKIRKYNQAITLLDFIKDKLFASGTDSEKEKFYICYSSIYLQQLPLNKHKICEVLKELINYTRDETNMLFRTALLYIHEDKISDALQVIEENTSKKPDIFLDLKAYILFTQSKYDELLEFLCNTNFVNKNVWLVRALLNTHKIEQAYEVIQQNKKEFEQDFEANFLKNHTECYYYLAQKDKIITDYTLFANCKSVLEEINSSIETSSDDTYMKSELLCDKMMLGLLLGDNDIKSCLEELEKLGSTNPNYLRNKALYDLTIRDFKKSYEEFDSYCKEIPEDEVAKELRAMALVEYNPKLAIEELGKLEDTLGNIPQKIKIVYAYFLLYQYEDAFNTIEQLKKDLPESFYIYNAYGDYYCSKQKHIEAFNNYVKAIKSADGNINKVDTFGRMMQIATSMQDSGMVDECIKEIPNFSEKALIECYAYELISLFICKKDFSSSLRYIEEYEKFFGDTPKINYLELLCYHNSGSNEKVIERYCHNHTGLVEEQIQQKIKMLVGAYQKAGDIKKAQSIFLLLDIPKTENDFIERIKAAKSLGLEKDCLQYALDSYKQFPNSLTIIEELLSVFVIRNDHSFDNNFEAGKIFNECLTKYSNVPEEKRNLKIFITPFMGHN